MGRGWVIGRKFKVIHLIGGEHSSTGRNEMDSGCRFASAKADDITAPIALALHTLLVSSPKRSVPGSCTTGASLTWTLAAGPSWINFELETVPPTSLSCLLLSCTFPCLPFRINEME